MSGLEIKTSDEETPLIPGQEPEFFPGLQGYAIKKNGAYYIPFVVSSKRGSGQFSTLLKYADDNHIALKFPCLISAHIKSILQSKGYLLTYEKDDIWGEMVDVWIKPSTIGQKETK